MPCFPDGLPRYEMHDEPRSLDPAAACGRDPLAWAVTQIGEGPTPATATADEPRKPGVQASPGALLTLDFGGLAVPAAYSTDASSTTDGPRR